MAKPTDGEWKARITEEGDWIVIFAGEKPIAQCYDSVLITLPKEEAKSNAKIMAASKELLAACEDGLSTLMNAIEAGCDDEDTRRHALAGHVTLKKLHAAIAKARG